MTKNMGTADRIIRTILGGLFVVVGLWQQGLWWILAAAGLIFLVTASVATCPLYMPFKISTRKSA